MNTDALQALCDESCRFEQTRAVLTHWLHAAAGSDGRYPEFDPIAVPRLLPFIYLLERQGDRLRYRVSGENVNALYSMQHTGRFLDEIVPAGIYNDVAPFFHGVASGRVLHFRGRVILSGREHLEFERTVLPITRRGETMLLGCAAFTHTAAFVPGSQGAPERGYHFDTIDLATGETRHCVRDISVVLNQNSRSSPRTATVLSPRDLPAFTPTPASLTVQS